MLYAVMDKAAQARAAAASTMDESITAFEGLRLEYRVQWPMNLIMNEKATSAYNKIMTFLMQVRACIRGR
jgi:hypothetical protein